MFRKMRRFGQQISQESCNEVLRQEKRGVLSVLGEDGYPYGLPIDFWYDEENQKICFHGAAAGHKIDAIKACDKVSFCAYDEGFRKEGSWALNIRSVIAFGRIHPVEDPERVVEICRNMCHKFDQGEAYLEQEFAHAGKNLLCLEMDVEHMTGKLVNES